MLSSSLLFLSCFAVLSFGAKDSCTCTYTGYAGDKCGNNPSVSVSLPTMTEGACTAITGFEEGYFDLAGLSFAGTSISSIVCNATSTVTSTSANSTGNSTASNSTSSNSTSNTSSSTCPGASIVTDYQSFTVVSCQGNEASVKFFQGSQCEGNGFTITLTKGKCTNLLEVLNLGWISYQLKCNRGGGSGSGSGSGALNLSSSLSALFASLLLLFTYNWH